MPADRAFSQAVRWPTEPHLINHLKRLSREIGFPVVDLNQLMAPYAANELIYHRDGTQWNDRGHEVITELPWRSAVC